jgi:hypothetical protein
VGEIGKIGKIGEIGEIGEVGKVEIGWKETEIWQIYSRFN